MSIRAFLSLILLDNNTPLSGESPVKVNNPYTKANLNAPIEVFDWNLSSEQTLDISSQGTGTGAGRIVFNELNVSKPVDRLSQQLFGFEAAGTPFRYIDLLIVNDQQQPPGGGAESALKPFLSYRFGMAGISRIDTVPDDATVRETVSFQFGLWLIGYQQTKPDGTLTAFAPTGWDRVRNIAISGSTPPVG